MFQKKLLFLQTTIQRSFDLRLKYDLDISLLDSFLNKVTHVSWLMLCSAESGHVWL